MLVVRPPLILLDEPTRGLDYTAKHRLVEILRDLADEGHAVLLATHDVELVAEVATRVLVMADGELVADGPTADVVVSSPAFAPQVAKILAPQRWLTPTQVAVALAVIAVPGRAPSPSQALPTKPDGKPGDDELVMTHAIAGTRGELVGVLLVSRNLAHLSRMQSTLAYSRKLVALGRLTAGIAHEVKNPLNAMMIHLELLRTKIRRAGRRRTAAGGRGGAAGHWAWLPSRATRASGIQSRAPSNTSRS